MAPQGGTTETDISSQSAKGDERENEHLRSRFGFAKSYVGALLPSVWGGINAKTIIIKMASQNKYQIPVPPPPL